MKKIMIKVWSMREDRAEIEVHSEGVKIAEGAIGGEPEDNSIIRDYRWIVPAIEAVAKETTCVDFELSRYSVRECARCGVAERIHPRKAGQIAWPVPVPPIADGTCHGTGAIVVDADGDQNTFGECPGCIDCCEGMAIDHALATDPEFRRMVEEDPELLK